MQGLKDDRFGFGFLPEEKMHRKLSAEEDAVKWKWQQLAETRLVVLLGANTRTYSEGLRFGRILMHLQAEALGLDPLIYPSSIDAYTQKVRIKNVHIANLGPNVEDQRHLREGRLDFLTLLDSELGRAAGEFTQYRWPGDKWQILMGIEDPYMIWNNQPHSKVDQRELAIA